MFIIFLLNSLFVLLNPSLAQAQSVSIQPDLTPKIEVQAQLSCDHIYSRYKVNPETLLHVSELRQRLRRSQTEFDGLDLYEYLKRKTGYSLGKILSEEVFIGKFQTKDLGVNNLTEVDAYAFFGAGGIDLRQSNPNKTIEFDMSAADVCFDQETSIVLFSHCPKEVTTFDVCNTDREICSKPIYWNSKPVVIQWWKCESEIRIPVDMSFAKKMMGLRTSRMGVFN